MKLLIRALTKLLAGMALMGALLFLTAGTWAYPGGWRLCALLFIPMTVVGLTLWCRAPALLEKRLNMKETEKTQLGVVAVSSVLFIAAFLLAGLDFHFGWTQVPRWLVWGAGAVMLLSYGLYGEILRENAYLSRTVEVQAGQRVIDTGLYGIVRHPMYAVTIAMYLAMPLVLGSWVSFAVMLAYPVVIVPRIRNEEQVLTAGLAGYAAYKQKVRWRLIPFIW